MKMKQKKYWNNTDKTAASHEPIDKMSYFYLAIHVRHVQGIEFMFDV